MKKIALIVAGGEGKRMNANQPKQFLLLNKLPILVHTLKKFSHLDKIILVLPYNQFDYWKKLCEKHNFSQKHKLVKGGKTRFHSVKNGLTVIDNHSIVAIHDGVRPIISTVLINTLISETKKGFGTIPVIPVKNSIREIKSTKSKHIDRSNLYKVQTPQCFLSADIKKSYKQNYSDKFSDDASVFEYYGGKIHTILGDEKNLKITTKEDLKITELFI